MTASINKAVSCTRACLYSTHCWAREECLADSSACNPLPPRTISNQSKMMVGSLECLVTSQAPETAALPLMAMAACGQGKEAAGRKDGWCKWISTAHTAWMEPSTVTLRPQQDGPSAASTTLALLMPRDPHWGLWAGGAAFSYTAFVNNTAPAVGGSLGSQSASCWGLCPQLGSVWNRDVLGLFLGQTKACSSECHCGLQAFISGPTCSVSSACKACVTLCVCSQNKHSNTLFCIFLSIRKPEQKKPVWTSQGEHP